MHGAEASKHHTRFLEERGSRQLGSRVPNT